MRLFAHWHIGSVKYEVKMCRTHRYDHISLLHFCPGEVLQELVARHAAKVIRFLIFRVIIASFFPAVVILVLGFKIPVLRDLR
jgi:hypothetical protein